MLFLNLDKIFRAISSSSEKKERSSRSGSSSSLAAVNKDFMFLFFFFTISREAHLINFISTIVLYTTRDLKFFCQNSLQLFFVLAFYLISLILIMVICQHFLIMVMYTAFFLSMGSYGKIT